MAQAQVGGVSDNSTSRDGASIKEIPAGLQVPGVNVTAAAPGAQIPAELADVMPNVPAPTKGPDGKIQPGTPIFNLLGGKTTAS